MKVRSLLVAALVVFSIGVAFAGEDEPRTDFAVVSAKGSHVYKVIYKSEAAAKVKLNIYDQAGTVIFSETVFGGNGFMVPLNFSGLNAGEYTIELVGAAGRKIEKVSYNPTNNIKQVHVSKLAKDEAKYLLAVANTGNEVIHVRIYDRNKALIHSESKEISGDFAQVYNLGGNASAYTFEVTDNNGNTKTVTF